MYQPKSLEELARVTINKSIKAQPHLRDLALPPRLMRELEEKFAEDRLDSELLKDRERYESLFLWFLTFDKSEVNHHQIHRLDPMERVCIMSYSEEEEVPFGYSTQTVISEWATYTYAGRIYRLCHACAVKQRGPKNKIVHNGKKSVCNEQQLLAHAKNPDNWCSLCPSTQLFGQTKGFTQETVIIKSNLCQK